MSSPDNNYIINLVKNKLNIEKDNISMEVLNIGKFANANVYLVSYTLDDSLHKLTIKDFSRCPFIIRETFGRIMANIEYSSIDALKDIPGISDEVFKLSPYTIGFKYIDGVPLKKCDKNSLDSKIFEELEDIMKRIHSRGIVHLDIRNFGNIILGSDGRANVIDFQSTMKTTWMPKKLRNILEQSDLSGVYKAWNKYSKTPIPDEKLEFLEDFKKIRKLWVFKGYALSKAIKRYKRNKRKKQHQKDMKK